VSTNFIDNLPTRSLKQDSLYLPAKEEIESVMNATKMRKNFVPVESYAEEVVTNALKARPTKRLWAGGVAGTLWIVQTFLWATSWVRGCLIQNSDLMLTCYRTSYLRKHLELMR
jgi:hypothetical protein